ncbi:MAG: YdiU family protein [Pseudomonadota bacterium]
MPIASDYRADPRHRALGPRFYDPVSAASFPEHKLRFRNDRWAARVGLSELSDAEWIARFGRFEPLEGNLEAPLALRYHGHQFQHYNPDLGDGRGFLFGQVRDVRDGRLLDFGTKGSGQTPWSRDGDGRLTLKGGVREVLATEYLEALGVYTSKSFSLIETGEPLYRNDEPSPARSAVLVRLSHSHIRLGSFQRQAFLQDRDAVETLVAYSVATYLDDATFDADAPRTDMAKDALRLFQSTVAATAKMAAEWYAAGFVHGVLNTDNTVITGESFDYGPWRILPTLDLGFTAAYFDQTGLYAFGRQPGALHWNLQRFADCLLPIVGEDPLVTALNTYGDHFETRLAEMTLARLGLGWPAGAEVSQVTETAVQPFYRALHASGAPFAEAFYDLIGVSETRLTMSGRRELYESDDWQAALSALRTFPKADGLNQAREHSYFARGAPETVLIETVEAIWSAIADADDWSAFAAKIQALRAMGEAYAPLLPARDGHIPIIGWDT